MKQRKKSVVDRGEMCLDINFDLNLNADEGTDTIYIM